MTAVRSKVGSGVYGGVASLGLEIHCLKNNLKIYVNNLIQLISWVLAGF